MVNEKLEKIKKIYKEDRELNDDTIYLVVDYLNDCVFNGSAIIEYSDEVPVRDETDMQLDVTSDRKMKIVVYKKQLKNICQIFEAFLHESMHVYQHVNCNNNKIYNIMFRINGILEEYSKRYNYDFYRENYGSYYFELDANIGSLKNIKTNISNGTWDFFSKADLEVINEKYEYYNIIDRIKNISFLGERKIPYDTYLIDNLLIILREDKSLIESDEVISKFFDFNVTFVDRILDFYEKPIFLNEYITMYLIEEDFLEKESVIKRINNLSEIDNEKFQAVINFFVKNIKKEISELMLCKERLYKYFLEKDQKLARDNCDFYIENLNLRLSKINAYLEKYVKNKKIVSQKKKD